MSILKQIALTAVILALAAGGWYAYRTGLVSAFLFGDSPAAVASVAPAGAPPPAGSASGETGRPKGQAGNGGESGRGTASGGGGGPGHGGGPVLVVTAPVAIDSTGSEIRAIGTAAAAKAVTLYPQVTGVVTAVSFTAGMAVKEGQPVVALDSADQEVAVDRAKVDLDKANEAVDRAERLAKSGNVTAVALSDAQVAKRQAEIDVRSAELELGKRTIRAPFAGTIGLSDLSVGDLVNSSHAIATIDDMTTLTVAFQVPERAAAAVSVGQAVNATADALAGATIAGTISAVDSRVDPATRTLRLEAQFPNDGNVLKPGMAVTVSVSIPGEPRPTVPSLALQWDRQGSFVWKVDGDVVHRTPVAIVGRRSGIVTVAGGLKEGDAVVVEGVLRLREGVTVMLSDEGGPATPAKAPAAEGSRPVSSTAADRPRG